jgi:hypothetical protein
MPGSPSDFFVKDFTGQWLDMDLLPEIMPDPKLRFTPQYVDMARSEVEYFFATMLRENRPMTDFIDPDFTYTSSLFAKHVYQLPIKHRSVFAMYRRETDDVRNRTTSQPRRNKRDLQDRQGQPGK